MKVDNMSVCSSEDGTADGVLTLERKSVQPYATQDEYLYAMKEDLSEWFHTLYDLQISVNDFFEVLETGVPLCRHANNVQSFILEKLRETGGVAPAPRPGHRPVTLTLTEAVQYRENVKSGSFQCRDNVSNFIKWCRGLGLPDCLLMETEDLVLRKNERSVVLCLLEVARQGARYGMAAPMLIQLEEEIDAEIAGEPPPPPTKHRPKIVCDLMSLDEMVREMLRKCTCPDQFPMIKVSDGKYRIGDSQTCIFVRILRNHVMVRIGGGWDTLEHYLDRHDPCRCNTKGHKTPRGVGSSPRGVPGKRRSSAPPAPPNIVRSTTPDPPATDGNTPQSRSKRTQSSGVGGGGVEGVRRSHDGRFLSPMPEDEVPPTKSQKMPRPVVPIHHGATSIAAASGARRASAPSGPGEDPAARRQLFVQDGRHKQGSSRTGSTTPRSSGRCTPVSGMSRNSSISDISQASEDASTDNRVSSSRGSSDSESMSNRGADPYTRDGYGTDGSTPLKNISNRGRPQGRHNIPQNGTPKRRRSVDREANHTPPVGKSQERKPRQVRSHSLDPNEIKKQLSKTAPAAYNMKKNVSGNENIMISRDKGGRHKITGQKDNVHLDGNEDRRPQGRMSVCPVRILPDKPKPKISGRSQTVDMGLLDDGSDTYESVAQRKKRLSSSSSVSLSSYDDLPEPEPNPDLNEHMERLFEEYRKVELGIAEKQVPDIGIEDVDSCNNITNKVTVNGNRNVVKSVISSSESKSFHRGRIGSDDNRPPSAGSSRPASPAPSNRRSSASSQRSVSPSPYNHRSTSKASMRRSPSPAPSSRYSVSSAPASSSRRAPSPSPATKVQGASSPRTPRRSVTPQPRNTPKKQPASASQANASFNKADGKDKSKPMSKTSMAKPNTPSAPPSRPSSRASSIASGMAQSNSTGKAKKIAVNANNAGPPPPSDVMLESTVTLTANSAPPTPSSADNEDFGFVIDVQADAPQGNILSGVPSEDCKAERVAAFVDEVRAKMQKQPNRPKRSQSARPASARQPAPVNRQARQDGRVQTPTGKQRPDTGKTAPRPAAHARSQRSRSKEDLLDSNMSSGMQVRGRSKSTPRIKAQVDRASNSSSLQDRGAQTVDSTPSTPERPAELAVIEVPTPKTAKPRLDDRGGRRTRIPIPQSRSSTWKTPESTPLRRYDSGVEINNMSPTDASLHGDDNHWQQDEITVASEERLVHPPENDSSQEYY